MLLYIYLYIYTYVYTLTCIYLTYHKPFSTFQTRKFIINWYFESPLNIAYFYTFIDENTSSVCVLEKMNIIKYIEAFSRI